MAIIHGGNIIVSKKVGNAYTAIAAAKSCDIDMDIDMIETSSPDSGSSKTYRDGRESWTVTVSGLVENMKGILTQRGQYDLKIAVTGSSTDYMTGKARIRRKKVTATKGNLSTYSVVFQGDGDLT